MRLSRRFFNRSHGISNHVSLFSQKVQLNATREYARNSTIHDIEVTLKENKFIGPNETYTDFLLKEKIITKGETTDGMFRRVAGALSEASVDYDGPVAAQKMFEECYDLIKDFKLILNTSIYTNAGRHKEKSLSACAVPPLDLKGSNLDEIIRMSRDYHTKGMGTGFNFDEESDPVSTLKQLNKAFISEVDAGIIERPVGNMGILSVDHPRALEFAAVKVASEAKEWKFNISMNITKGFMEALNAKKMYKTKDGNEIDPLEFMKNIAYAARATGDPGLVFMHRHEADNKIPHIGRYVSVAPCGEAPLLKGEVCQFSYINLTRFVKGNAIQYDDLRYVVHKAVMLLDNAIDVSISRLPTRESGEITSKMRKIGLGVCGFSDVLLHCGIPYASIEARKLGENVMSFINYESKRASIELAKNRGPFPLFEDPRTLKELIVAPYIDRPTNTVGRDQWIKLDACMRQSGIRNISTVILPPTGRSALMGGVSASIEPPFKLTLDNALRKSIENNCKRFNYQGNLAKNYGVIKDTGSVDQTDFPEMMKEIYHTCLEVSPETQLEMTAAFQRYTDESIAKTINLREGASAQDIMDIYIEAYNIGLKGITVYVDKSRDSQPKDLLNTNNIKSKTNHLSVQDPIYGTIEIPEQFIQIIESEEFKRLSLIHQNGIDYLVDSRRCTTRFQHSIGVMNLVKILGGDISQQLSGLLHDISHTAFSHLIDQVFELKEQNYHDRIRSDYLKKSNLIKLFEELNISKEMMLREDHFSIVKAKGPDLSADRIDYLLRELLNVNLISREEAQSIIQNLSVNDDVIMCKNIEAAKFVFNKFIELNKTVFFNPDYEAANIVFKYIINGLIEKGKMQEKDFMKSEEYIINLIQKSEYKELLSSISDQFEHKIVAEENGFFVNRKLRFVDPRVASHRGKRLTELDDRSQRLLEQYKQQPTKIHYDISNINEHIEGGPVFRLNTP